MTTGLLDARGDAPIQDLDFANVIAGIEAGNVTTEVLPPQHRCVSGSPPEGVDPSHIAAATVFTTGDPNAVGAKLRDAVHDTSKSLAFDQGPAASDAPHGPVACDQPSNCKRGQLRSCTTPPG
ncbi:MAG: hypothetical protein R3C68_00650 [Myxococcota bacterium]